MRDIDNVRLVLSRLEFPPDIIDAIMKPIFMPLKRASITIQRYARGLLARFRDTRLSYANFNRDTKRAMLKFTGDDAEGNDPYDQAGDPLNPWRGWDHYDLVKFDNRGYNAIRNTTANRHSFRNLDGLMRHTWNRAYRGIWWRGWEVRGDRTLKTGPRETEQREERMYNRNQKRFEWLVSKY